MTPWESKHVAALRKVGSNFGPLQRLQAAPCIARRSSKVWRRETTAMDPRNTTSTTMDMKALTRGRLGENKESLYPQIEDCLAACSDRKASLPTPEGHFKAAFGNPRYHEVVGIR